MTTEKLQEAVAKRANEQVQKAIADLRRDIGERVKHFLGEVQGARWDVFKNGPEMYDEPKEILTRLASAEPTKGWPAKYWDFRKAQVLEEVLSTMDALQRTLAARDAQVGDAEPAA